MNAPKEKPSFYGVKTAPWTHINLLTGRKGRVVDFDNAIGRVEFEDERRQRHNHDMDSMHLTWAPLNSNSQGEQA